MRRLLRGSEPRARRRSRPGRACTAVRPPRVVRQVHRISPAWLEIEGLPAEHEALPRLDHFDDARVGAAGPGAAMPFEDDRAAWSQRYAATNRLQVNCTRWTPGLCGRR